MRVSDEDILGEEGKGLQTAQLFVHENRIRQAASSLGQAYIALILQLTGLEIESFSETTAKPSNSVSASRTLYRSGNDQGIDMENSMATR
ncbi:MAG: hypothetical protein CM15mP49_33810 [Actinomycetota bacterium]|nr:MAG: hypothetical protein CM15mP49_33810 [Actinomycetota bacterium]